jgi:hypothetical protein
MTDKHGVKLVPIQLCYELANNQEGPWSFQTQLLIYILLLLLLLLLLCLCALFYIWFLKTQRRLFIEFGNILHNRFMST